MQTQTLARPTPRTDTDADAETDVVAAVPPQSRAAHHPETEPDEPARARTSRPRAPPRAPRWKPSPRPPSPSNRPGGRAADTGGPSSDLFRQYLREIGRIPLLTAAEEVDLARRVEAGLFAEEKLRLAADLDSQLALDLDKLVVMGRMAKRRLIEANLRLVVSVAKRYVGRGPDHARPGPGGKPRPDQGGREVRLRPRLQVLDVRDLVDPPGHVPGPRRPGPHHPRPGPRRRADQPGRARAAPHAPGARLRTDPRRGRRPPRPAAASGSAKSCGWPRNRCPCTRPWARRTTSRSAT